jgi:hypothetical protein
LFSLFHPCVEPLNEAFSLHEDRGLESRDDVDQNPTRGHVQLEAAPGQTCPAPIVFLEVVVEDFVNLKQKKYFILRYLNQFQFNRVCWIKFKL